MRLLIKTLLFTLPVIGLVLLGGAALFVNSLEKVIEINVQRTLHYREVVILQHLERDPARTLRSEALTNVYSIAEVPAPFYGRIEKDTVLFDDVDQKDLLYRQLTFGATVGKANYRISVRKEQVDRRLIEEVISTSMLIIFVLMGVVLVVLMVLISSFLWKPFYHALETLRGYNLQSGVQLKLDGSSTKEFQQLKSTLEDMSSKVLDEFRQLKEFTENVSHEISTPVTIIKARAEILLQSEGMNEDELRNLISIQQAADRLSRTTEGLLMLIRIDRGTFDIKGVVDFETLFRQKARWLDDLILLKSLTFTLTSDAHHHQTMNESLADMLAHNVLSNAVKYNVEKGWVRVHLHDTGFVIENTGIPRGPAQPVFKRYHTEDSFRGLGLGLSIVEKICSFEKIDLQYENHDSIHRFRFTFMNRS